MGQQISALAERHALQGWPAFMTATDLRAQMSKFRVVRSVLGRRVRLIDGLNGCIEYARLSKVPGKGAQFYQRVDGPCSERLSVPKFPHALAAHELPGGASLPYDIIMRRANRCQIADAGAAKCATYLRSKRGHWVKATEHCPGEASAWDWSK